MWSFICTLNDEACFKHTRDVGNVWTSLFSWFMSIPLFHCWSLKRTSFLVQEVWCSEWFHPSCWNFPTIQCSSHHQLQGETLYEMKITEDKYISCISTRVTFSSSCGNPAQSSHLRCWKQQSRLQQNSCQVAPLDSRARAPGPPTPRGGWCLTSCLDAHSHPDGGHTVQNPHITLSCVMNWCNSIFVKGAATMVMIKSVQ